MKRLILLIAVGVGILLAPHSGVAQDPAEPAPRPLTVDDYFRIHGVGDPQVSPGGRWVAYTVTAQDLEKDESKTRIWMMPTAGACADDR